MFDRKIEKNLIEWKNKKNRKPLVLRGARQTGKTTLVRKFSGQFKNFIELNLEKDPLRKIFASITDTRDIVQSIEGLTNQRIIPGETLLFLDEIQNSANAIKSLRYFYEEMPDLHVISAGSLLEVRMKNEGWSFPVGRIEFLYLFPVTFDEFLLADNERIIFESLMNYQAGDSFPVPLHDKLINLLADYMVVGGMPEAVSEYISSRNFASIRKCQEILVSSFKEDFVKYSKSFEVEYLKLIWDRVPFEIGKRIKYSKLAGSHTRSKNISNAFDVLHDAMLIERIYPTVATAPPLVKKPRAAFKAAFLDIGLCTHALNLTRDQIKEDLIATAYRGALFEALISQELLAMDIYNRGALYFWVREEKSASSELDFLVQVGNKLVPIEVKSGSQGALKSLHQFLRRSGLNFGLRIYSGPLRLESYTITLPGREQLNYDLLSLPFYLTFRLPELCGKHLA